MINLHSIIKDDVFNDAACLDAATNTFFPAKADDYEAPRAICAECPLMTRQTCLDLAMHAENGLWPGWTRWHVRRPHTDRTQPTAKED